MRVFSNNPEAYTAADLQPHITAAIFDFDGTLFDSEHTASQCVFDAIAQQSPSTQLSTSEQKALEQRCLGRSLTDILDTLAKAMKLDPQQLAEDYRKLWHKSLHKNMAIDDSITLVKQLHQQGIAVSICTGSELDQVTPLLKMQAITQLFSHIVTADDYGHGEGKPCPTPYLLSIKHHCVHPQHAIVFEDSVVGVQAAKAAKVGKIVALCHRPNFEKYLRQAGADLVVTSLQDSRVLDLFNINNPAMDDDSDRVIDRPLRSRL